MITLSDILNKQDQKSFEVSVKNILAHQSKFKKFDDEVLDLWFSHYAQVLGAEMYASAFECAVDIMRTHDEEIKKG